MALYYLLFINLYFGLLRMLKKIYARWQSKAAKIKFYGGQFCRAFQELQARLRFTRDLIKNYC
jgi:hypothetical protein